MVCIAIQDYGIGIPIEQRVRVFQPFVRLRPTDTPGSGIGLAIVQRIVNTLRRRSMDRKSRKARGARLSFTLPWLRNGLEEGARRNSRKLK